MGEITSIECFKNVDDIKSAFSKVKDLKRYKQRIDLAFILYRLSLLKEYDGLIENNNIMVSLNDIYNNFINNLKNKDFYFSESGSITNITFPLEIHNVGFITSDNIKDAIDRLHSVGYIKMFETEFNCKEKKLYIASLYQLEQSAIKYIKDNNIQINDDESINKYEMFRDMDDFVYQINLIKDLDKLEHRKLLFQIIMRLLNSIHYSNYLDQQFYRLINIEITNMKDRVKNSEYIKIFKNTRNKNDLEFSVLKELLVDSTDINRSLNYILCVMLSTKNFVQDNISITDIIKINESSVNYFNNKANKYRTMMLRTGE